MYNILYIVIINCKDVKMSDIWMKKCATFGIVVVFVFVACIPAVTSHFEMESREFPILDTITIDEWSSDDCTQCLDVYSWPLLDNTARVTAYSGNGYGALSHRIIRGLGVKGGEYDEIDSIRNMERIEVTFNSPQYLTFFEVRSLFARGFTDPITEEGDVDLYLGSDLVKHYDIAGVYPYGIIGKVRVTISPTILMDKIVFYVDEDEDYSSYSEFTLAKIGVVNDDVSFVIPFSGIDVVKRCLFQLDMNVLDGEADDSFDVFVDDMFVYGYIDEPPVNDSEAWHMHSIDLFSFIMPSSEVHTVRINATGEQWCGQPTYGQVAVDTIELYNVNVTMHQGIRRLAYRRVDVATLPLCCDPPVLGDSVDIGKPVSEAGHNLQEWGPIEPETHGGYYGGIDDCRVTWQSADSFRWATVDLACDVEKYSLTIGLVGNGTTYPEPGTYSYISGTVVDLEAIPDIGWSFNHWDGDVADPNSAITNITINDDEEVTAYFTEDQYTLDIIVDGNGTVIKNPDKTYYFYNESVNLTAVPDTGWSFDHWSGDLNGTENPTTICMNISKEVTATFIEEWYTLNITTVGNGTVDVDPIGPYRYGTEVTITAIPDQGWSFDSWSGDLTGSDNPETIIMDGNKEVTAYFTGAYYMLNITVDGNGTVIKNPDKPYYIYGEEVELTAVADVGWDFDHWQGDVADPSNPITTITMDSNKEVTVMFTETPIYLCIDIVGNGHVDVVPVGPYRYGDEPQLTAVADPGWTFKEWSGDLNGSENPTTIFMDGYKEVTATFTEDQYALNITIIGHGTVMKKPDQETYTYGTLVELTAVADPSWAFDYWEGDINGSDNPSTIVMTKNMTVIATFTLQGWLATLIFSGQITFDNSTDTVVFGEKPDASDGIDIYDVPKPDAPPSPYVYAWFATDLPTPHDILWEEYRHYPADEQVWNLWGETDGAGETTVVTITWDIDDIAKGGYDYVGLYDVLTGHCVADMKSVGTYTYIADNGMAYHFQIRCTDNHAPVANNDPDYKTMESFEIKVPEVLGVLVNDYDEDEDVLTAVLETEVSNGTLTLNADGSFDYMPDLDFFGNDTFTYKAYDGELYSNIATVTITVLQLNRISIKDGWNLFSIPVGEDMDKTKIIVKYLSDDYTWDDAIDEGIILGFTYGWKLGMYSNENILVPGEGYWMWAFEDCDLLIPSNVPADNHITYLDVGWNLVGVHEDDLLKTDILVQYDGQWLTWSEAVGDDVILDFIYGWDSANQNYTLSDIFVSGYGYWVYAYHGCALKEPL
jgi:VCBS repeat-containing protein